MSTKYRILLIFVTLFLLLGLWYSARKVGYALAQGPTRYYDVGSHFLIEDGYVSFLKSEDIGHEMIISEKIIELSVDDARIIGKTEKGYFIIQKQDGQIEYPIEDIEAIRSISGDDFTLYKWKDWIDKYSDDYTVQWPQTGRTVLIIDIFFLIFVFIYFTLIACFRKMIF